MSGGRSLSPGRRAPPRRLTSCLAGRRLALRTGARPFPPALRALEADTIDVRPLISERVPLRDAEDALRRAAEPNQLKVLLEP